MAGRRMTASVMILWGLLVMGCHTEAEQPADYEYPAKDPICLIEYDPYVSLYEPRTAEFQPLPVGKVLVIPLYRNYSGFGRRTMTLTISHPFLYTQCDDIERQLAAFGERENLARLIIWARGCFPTRMPHLAFLSPTINGRRVDVLQVQRCTSEEDAALAVAMKKLLSNEDFVIRQMVAWRTQPPYSNEPRRGDCPERS